MTTCGDAQTKRQALKYGLERPTKPIDLKMLRSEIAARVKRAA
jgi:hypothetical protein